MLTEAEEVLPQKVKDVNPPFVVPIEQGKEFRGYISMENPEFWEQYLVGALGQIVFVEEGEGGHSFSRPLQLSSNPFRFFWNVAPNLTYFSGNVRIAAIEWDTKTGHYPIYVGL